MHTRNFLLLTSFVIRPILFLIMFFITGVSVNLNAVLRDIAVLNFANLTGNKKNEWVAEAFAEAVTGKLRQVTQFNVIDRDTLYASKKISKLLQNDINKKIEKKVAELSGADFLIFGSVQSAGSLTDKNALLRVHARIVDTTQGVIHHAIIIDGKLSNIYRLQFKLTRKFLDIAKINASIAELNAMKSVGTLSLEAYRLYNIGLLNFRRKKFPQAKKCFEKSMFKHPGILYAEAHNKLGQCYLRMGKKEELLIRFRKDAASLSPIFFDLGKAYEKSGKYSKAVSAYKTFLRYTANRAVLWQKCLRADKVQIISSIESPYFICREKNRISCMKSNNGEVKWTKKMRIAAKSKMILIKEAIYIKEGRRIRYIDCQSGKISSASVMPKTKKTSRIFKHMDFFVEVTKKVVKVRDKNNKAVWKYRLKGSSKIVGYNNNTLCVSDGIRIIKGVKIQNKSIPTDVEGLLSLAFCLQKTNKKKMAIEVYRYINRLIK